MSINFAAISGNVVRDAELRTTNNGMQVLSFTVAVNESRKNSAGEWVNVPNYVDCIMFGNRAEKLSKHVVQGLKVSLSGKLRFSKWETKEGQKRTKLEIVVDQFEFMTRQGEQQEKPKQPEDDYLPF